MMSPARTCSQQFARLEAKVQLATIVRHFVLKLKPGMLSGLIFNVVKDLLNRDVMAMISQAAKWCQI